jgi:hypothetical protein
MRFQQSPHYEFEGKVKYILFFIPITVYTMPDRSSMTPAMPMAGVRVGWIGSGLPECAAVSLIVSKARD